MPPLRSQFAWISGGRIVAAGAQAITLVIVARSLGPADFGLLSTLLGLAVIPQVVCDLGIGTYVLHKRAIVADSGSVTFALRVNGWTSALAAAVFVGILASVALVAGPVVFLAAPLALWVGAEKNADTWANVLIADRDVVLSTAQLVVRRVLAAGLTIGLLIAGIDAILAYSVAVAIAAVGSSVWARAIIRPRLAPIEPQPLSALIRETWPYWTHSVATQARSLDAPITAAVAGVTQAGFYAAAGRLTNPLRILPTSLASVVLPHIARQGGHVSVETRRAIALLMIAMSGLFVALAATAPLYIPWLLGDAFEDAVLPVQIVVTGLIFGSAASILVSLHQARGGQRYVSFASIATSLYCVPAVFLGASMWGAVGAAIALSSTFLLQSTLLLLRLRRRPNMT